MRGWIVGGLAGAVAAAGCGGDAPAPGARPAALAVSVAPPAGALAPGLSSRLERFLEAAAAVGGPDRDAWPEARLDPEGRLLVWARDVVGGPLAPEVEAHVEAVGGSVRARARTGLDAWVPVAALPALARTPGLRVDLPRWPAASVGLVDSEGVALAGAPAFHDAGVDGSGVDVAVVDLTFALFAEATAAGDLVDPASSPPTGDSNAHGTACAEIVQDVAPGARIHPVRIATFVDLEAFVDGLAASDVDVISDSLVWTEDSFSDGTGPHCALVDRAREAGVAWVTSAGNRGDGSFWTGTFTDEDGDGRHEFAPEDERNELDLDDREVLRVVLDWDDYPATAEDYDLVIVRVEDGVETEVARSDDRQDGGEPPYEIQGYRAEGAGTYALVIEAVSASRTPIRMRLFPTVGVRLEHASAARSLEDPAHCAHVLAVGAVPQGRYAAGPIWPASARGPTMDDREKPDLVAPTAVVTASLGRFVGTSASAPHVAGAVALYASHNGGHPRLAAAHLREDATAYADNDPNREGAGRLTLDPARLAAPPCLATTERCNGADDDCDGETDEAPACDPPDAGPPDAGTDADAGAPPPDAAAPPADAAPPDAAAPRRAHLSGSCAAAGAAPPSPASFAATLLLALTRRRPRRHRHPVSDVR